jgi:hypothetical protein
MGQQYILYRKTVKRGRHQATHCLFCDARRPPHRLYRYATSNTYRYLDIGNTFCGIGCWESWTGDERRNYDSLVTVTE